MNAFNRLPGFTRTPPGKERKVIRALPMIFLVGTLLLAMPSIFVRFFRGPQQKQKSPQASLALTST